MSARHYLMLTVLAAIWGSSFLFIRISVPWFGPIPLNAARSMVAALALSPLLFGRGRMELIRQYWGHLLVIGIISTALPYTFLSISTEHSSAGFASILNALTPISSVLISRAWLKEPLTLSVVGGICLGFVGVTVMVFDQGSFETQGLLLIPVAAGLTAAFFYGLTGVYNRRFLSGLPSTLIASGCQVSSALFMLPLALLQWPEQAIPPQGWIVAAVLGVLCTGVAFILYFHLLEAVGIARTVIVTYLIPVFAMLWGFLFLGETVSMKMALGAVLILTGIGLTTGLRRAKAT